MKLKLKDLKNNPYHSGDYDRDQIEKLKTSIKTLGLLRSFSVIKKVDNYYLVCSHHTREAAKEVLGEDAEVEVTIQKYDDDTATWGMAVENLTQNKDKKKQIDELWNIKSYLKKKFKTYPEFIKFMKSVGVGITYSEERKDGQKKRENNSPLIGSSRHIRDWLNRKGIIMHFTEINELIRIKENLAPEIYKKMQVNLRNDQDDHSIINYSNCVQLSRIPDKKEQKEILNALQNSNEERVHRVRTRAKIVSNYLKTKEDIKKKKEKASKEKSPKKKKEILEEVNKKETSLTMIREGKKDIGNIKEPNVELPKLKVSNEEKCSELREEFRRLEMKMDDWKGDALPNLTQKQLGIMILYLQSWGKDTFAPFVNEVAKKIAKNNLNPQQKDETIVEFDFK